MVPALVGDLDRSDVLKNVALRKLAAQIGRQPAGPTGRVLATVTDEDARQAPSPPKSLPEADPRLSLIHI